MQVKRWLLFSVFLSAVLFAFTQTEEPDIIRDKFVQYQLHHFQEKIYVHIAKTFYIAGETVWFKVYDVDGYFHRPLMLSRIVYIEILSDEQRPVMQAKIEMQEGMGKGSFSIPVSIGSGHYRLRAYSSWMKNFNPDYYFEQSLTIVNTLREATPVLLKRTNAVKVQFFPEGGNLVAGLQSKLAFKASNQFGEGVDCQGVIINQRKDTLARFQSLRLGMGHFLFKPQSGDQYTVLVHAGDSVYQVSLPEIYPQGYTMQLTAGNEEKLTITVQSNIPNNEQRIYLLVHSRQLIKNTQAGNLNKQGEISFFVDRALLADGISSFTVFNAARQPVCERIYCKRPAKTLSIQVKTNQASYSTRSRIDLDLLTQDQSNLPLKANMSLSVFLLDSLQTLPGEDIRSYLLLRSELKGNIESPSYYFEQDDAVRSEALDNLMLTQGWRRFRWEALLNAQHPFFEYLPETEGPVITGKITNKRTGRPGENIMAYLSVPGRKFNFTNAISDSNGTVHFNPDMIYGNSEVIASLNYRTDSMYTMDIQPSYADKFASMDFPEFVFPSKWTSQLLDRSINMQVENTYLLDKKHRILPQQFKDTTHFYGYPDKQYNLDDYTRFKTMEEVIKEYVADVRVRKESDKYYFRVNNMLLKEFFDTDPLVLLDGVPVFDLNRIMDINPLKVQKIEVVSGRFYQGSLANTGIVSFQTYDGDLAGFELDPGSVVVEYDGIQRQREFYAPVYDSANKLHSPVPDFRNLLSWSPDIRTGTDGKKSFSFFSSDLPGNYAILVEGLTAEGTAGSKVARITVNKP
jgi:hypothetical protein